MADNFKGLVQEISSSFSDHPKVAVIGIGGAGCNAINNMIDGDIKGVEFFVINTDNQSINMSKCNNRIHIGQNGLGAGSIPEQGRIAAEYSLDDVFEQIGEVNMVFIAAGMGGGTGTGASPVIAKRAREMGALTVAVVTKPFIFEGNSRMLVAEEGIRELEQHLDTMIIVPNQNIFKLSSPETTFKDAFAMADQVLNDGVRGITDLMIQGGLVNLDFSDVKTIMSDMGRSIMGVGVSDKQEDRGIEAAIRAINNPLMDSHDLSGAKGILMNITGGPDMTLFEVEGAAKQISQEASDARLIFGACIRDEMEGKIQVTVFAAGVVDTSKASKDSIQNQISKINSEDAKQSQNTLPGMVNDMPGNNNVHGITDFDFNNDGEYSSNPSNPTIDTGPYSNIDDVQNSGFPEDETGLDLKYDKALSAPEAHKGNGGRTFRAKDSKIKIPDFIFSETDY